MIFGYIVTKKKCTNFESEKFEGVEQAVMIVKDHLEELGQMFHNLILRVTIFFHGTPKE